MPATITHAFFAKDVYDILPKEIRDLLDVKRCKMFGQSVDSLMFYNLFSIMPGKKIRGFQYYIHTHNTQELFLNIIQYMKENNIQDKDTYSFLEGFICHYVLDSTIHPYVVYKTGVFRKKYPNTYKYNNVHAFMETFIDNDMVKRRFKKNPYTFDIASFCFDLKPFSKELNHTIGYSFYRTYHLTNMDSIYYKSLKQMRSALKVFRRDPSGIKKNIYKFVDTITPKGVYRFEAISYHYPLEDKHNYLNTNHSLWRNPTTYDMTSNESFVDLYLKAIKLAKVLSCASFDYISGKDIDLEKIFDNTSYVTGIDCNSPKELRFFEF